MMNGYKETKIGRIPEDWRVLMIKELGKTESGGTPYRKNPNYYDGDIPWIKTGELSKKYINHSEENITHEGLINSSAKLIPKGTLIVAMYGATIGKLSILKIESATNQACCAIICDKTITNEEFLYYSLLNRKNLLISMGAGGAQPNISQQIIKKFSVPIPPLSEQKIIAKTLSTIDEAIEKTAAIIEETRQLKKGLMQKLFTEGIGHTQFKETKIGRIPEEWEIVKLEEYTKIIMGQSPSSSDCNDEIRGFPFFQGNGEFGSKYPIAKYWTTNPTKLAQPDDILMSVRAPVGEFNISNSKCCIGRGLCAIRPSVQIDLYFTLYCLKSSIHRLKRLEQGSTFTAVNKTDITTFEIPYPPIGEQSQITKILSKVDAKIEKEVATKVELEQLKKGLMQVLLTGQIRVKVKA